MRAALTRTFANGRGSGTGVVIYASALVIGAEFLVVGAVAILSSATSTSVLPGAFALAGGLALLLGSERLARNPFKRASALLVGVATLLGVWPAFGGTVLAVVSAVDAIPRRPLEGLTNIAIPALFALVVWLSYRWAAWRVGRTATGDQNQVQEPPADEFNDWILVVTMYMLVTAGAGGFAVIVARHVFVPH